MGGDKAKNPDGEMSYHLIIRKRAEKHLAEAYAWYEGQRTGLGAEFMLCIDAKLQVVKKNPFLFQARHKHVRCALVPRFPYGVYYFVDESKIVVIAFFHLSRNPKLWQR